MSTERAPARLDRAHIRRSFERAAATYDAVAVLQREVGARMAERLGVIRLEPATILDAGCGTGEALGELATRFPGARLIGLDLAWNMVRAAQQRAPPVVAGGRSLLNRLLGSGGERGGTRPALVCGDIAALPLAPATVDLVWSNLALQWIDAPGVAFAEFRRVLAIGGLLSFTTFGPDTLRELRAAFATVDNATHVSRFIDMHDLGDMLVHAGFADPVMDMETLTLTYADADALMRELKSLGAHNAASTRSRGLMGRGRWRRMLAALEGFRREDRLPASFEVIYGHAWKAPPRVAADGRAIVQFTPPGSR
ncbi:MAG: malonyl-ACP O-methyltransferase BioC [Casimicrobiaceae bacterium]